MIERHYNGETYQLQLDSHMRFDENWDIKLIEMLHSCDAGEKSVITAYAGEFGIGVNEDDGKRNEFFYHAAIKAMYYPSHHVTFCWNSFIEQN